MTVQDYCSMPEPVGLSQHCREAVRNSLMTVQDHCATVNCQGPAASSERCQEADRIGVQDRHFRRRDATHLRNCPYPSRLTNLLQILHDS